MSTKFPSKQSSSRLAQIARRDYMKKNDLEDEDEDEDTGEGYDIDPSTNMWKPIEFGKSYSKKNIAAGFHSSNSETKLPSVSSSSSNPMADKNALKIFPDIKEGAKYDPKPPERSLETSLPPVSLPMVAIPKPLTDPPKKKSSPRMSKQEFDEVNSLIYGLNTQPPPSRVTPLPIQPPPQQQRQLQQLQQEQQEQERKRQKEIDELLKEKELMQQKLELIEKEKREMSQRTTELTTQLLLTSQQRQHEEEVERLTKLAKEKQEQHQIELLTREKEEMQRMIQQIKTEKEEEMSRLVTQRNLERSHESELLTRDRENLRNELEQVRIQNELLIKQMKSTQLLSQQELEEVKLQRVQEVTAIEEKNKKITEEILLKQAESERKLAAERDELKGALQRMENEKLALSQKIYLTESAAKKETAQLLKQRKEFEMKLISMENEKSKLFELVAANEMKLKTSSENANAAATEKLTEELSALSSQLSQLENDKKSLEENIQDSEEKTTRVMEELKLKLEREKSEYRESIARMEEEKLEMATLLTKTEKEAKEYALEVRAQLKHEQQEMEATKNSINEERLRIEAMLSEVNQKRSELEKEVREEVREMKDAARTEVQNEVKEVNKVKLELEATLEMIRREKLEMEMRMKEAAELAIQREREMAEQVCRERDELRKAVERMREEMEEEKKRREEERKLQEQQQQQQLQSAKRLDSSSSLFNLMEEDGNSLNSSHSQSQSEKSFRHNRSCAAMVPIVEMPSHDLSEENTTVEIRDEEGEGEGEGETIVSTEQRQEEDQQEQQQEQEEQQEDIEPDEFIDLPLPHAAAARGDLSTLESLYQLDPSLLASFDSAGRTPLFYAVAYNHTTLTSYLMEASPECIFQTDCHGDAPLHAAASSGSAQCVDLIIHAMAERGVEGVDLRNNMGMTPAHLASNAEVLAMLHAAGANLSIPDHNHRTALFVAAAMNRQDCVQYFIDCFDSLDNEGCGSGSGNENEGNEEERNIIYLADNRGDTPLHAAACNGAEESLLLLLQCGISPLKLNHKGLKAIDLAQKNKKKKCREILAQYHLHFATTSDFDSVLFIAALEGQKKVQDAMLTALASPEEEGYNIIKNCHIENLQDDERKEKVKGLFSLKKSLRLKRWGSWIAYEDQNLGSTYFYNHKTGDGQWKIPVSVANMMKKQHSISAKSSRSILQISNKASMRLKKVGDWIQYCTEAGQTFYYNDKNGDFQWSNPERDRDRESEEHQQTTGSEMMEQAKEEEWVPYKDPESGCIFWYNKRTKISQWECPIAPPQGDSHSVAGDWNAAEEGVVEVHNDSDLGID